MIIITIHGTEKTARRLRNVATASMMPEKK
jgi:hypothetical protein